MESFEQRMKIATSDDLSLPCAMIEYEDGIKLAREADAALAARQRENISIKEVMVEQARKIERLTDINAAKGELIEFYANYISGVTGYMVTHQMGPSAEVVAEGERLRARIRSLENE